jgi:hypothetical protein
MIPDLGLDRLWGYSPRRAISVQLGHGHEPSRRSVVGVVAVSPEEHIEALGDGLVRRVGGVLVDERGPLVVVAHPLHEVSRGGAGRRGEHVARMPQVVEVQSGHAQDGDQVNPSGDLVEVAAPQRTALDAGEDQGVRFVLGVLVQVRTQVGDE